MNLMVISMVLVGLTTVLPFQLINALPQYAEDLPSAIGGNCRVCHVSALGGGRLNSFGDDFEENLHNFDVVAKLDSDGDGHSNVKELKAGTYPGDPDSNPSQGIPGLPYKSVLIGIAIVVLPLWWIKRGTKRVYARSLEPVRSLTLRSWPLSRW